MLNIVDKFSVLIDRAFFMQCDHVKAGKIIIILGFMIKLLILLIIQRIIFVCLYIVRPPTCKLGLKQKGSIVTMEPARA